MYVCVHTFLPINNYQTYPLFHSVESKETCPLMMTDVYRSPVQSRRNIHRATDCTFPIDADLRQMSPVIQRSKLCNRMYYIYIYCTYILYFFLRGIENNCTRELSARRFMCAVQPFFFIFLFIFIYFPRNVIYTKTRFSSSFIGRRKVRYIKSCWPALLSLSLYI